MGIELDVLVGHPEHDLLFLATQAAAAAGMPNAKVSVVQYLKRRAPEAFKLGDLAPTVNEKLTLNLEARPDTRNWRAMWLMPEHTLYQMLLRGNAKASEPFRKWVTEEVLPTIRKTGRYDAEKSTNPTDPR